MEDRLSSGLSNLIKIEVVLTYKIMLANKAKTLSAALTVVISKCKMPLHASAPTNRNFQFTFARKSQDHLTIDN